MDWKELLKGHEKADEIVKAVEAERNEIVSEIKLLGWDGVQPLADFVGDTSEKLNKKPEVFDVTKDKQYQAERRKSEKLEAQLKTVEAEKTQYAKKLSDIEHNRRQDTARAKLEKAFRGDNGTYKFLGSEEKIELLLLKGQFDIDSSGEVVAMKDGKAQPFDDWFKGYSEEKKADLIVDQRGGRGSGGGSGEPKVDKPVDMVEHYRALGFN